MDLPDHRRQRLPLHARLNPSLGVVLYAKNLMMAGMGVQPDEVAYAGRGHSNGQSSASGKRSVRQSPLAAVTSTPIRLIKGSRFTA